MNANEQIYELLNIIKRDYGLYIGEKSVRRLSHFLSGYTVALNRIYGQTCTFNSDFQKYIEAKYCDKTRHHWSDILCYYHHTDEAAFDNFFELLDEFKRTNK